MASNSFGQIFKVTTWGESHGKAIGVVIDGCPAGLEIDESYIERALRRRAPGHRALTSPRKETDIPEILSGVFKGKTTGAPLSILIRNQDSDSSKYEQIEHLLKPGHANYAYLQKYGIFDHQGGGRASARETACRVAAGAVAKKILEECDIGVIAYLQQVEEIKAPYFIDCHHELSKLIEEDPLFCPDAAISQKMAKRIAEIRDSGDSIGGCVAFLLSNVPPGLGDPVYEKLDARLAYAMMGIPAVKGFEIGSGFDCVRMFGSEHNDCFELKNRKIETETNHAGGILGGISIGTPIIGRIAFKPPSSIKIPQKTLDIEGNPALFQLSEGSRHDPCVAIRAVPVVEAMCSLVLADLLLLQRAARI